MFFLFSSHRYPSQIHSQLKPHVVCLLCFVGMPFRCVSHVFALLHTRARNVKFTQGSAVPRSCDVLRLRPIPAVVRVRIKCESSKESAGWAGARRTPR